MSQSSSSSDFSSSNDFDPIDLIPSIPPQPLLLLSDHPLPSVPEPAQSGSSQLTSLPSAQLPGFVAQPSSQSAGSPQSSDEDDEDDPEFLSLNRPFAQHGDSSAQPIGQPKANPTTAASRGWMSQRKGKAIHIDGHHPITNADTNTPDGRSAINSASAQRVKELGTIEEQLAKLLSLAGEALGCLTCPVDDKQPGLITVESFSSSISEYFETLNKIQLGLRTSMSHIRAARISTRILFEPANTPIPNCPVGLGDLNAISKLSAHMDHKAYLAGQSSESEGPMLSVASLTAERDAWKDLVDSLEQLKTTLISHSGPAQPDTPVPMQ